MEKTREILHGLIKGESIQEIELRAALIRELTVQAKRQCIEELKLGGTKNVQDNQIKD